MNTGPLELRLQKLQTRLGWLPYFILFTGLFGTAIGSWYVAETGADKDRARFRNEIQGTIEKIGARIATYENLMRGVAGFFAGEPSVSADEFRMYVDRLDLSYVYPGIQGIGYSVRVRAEDVSELEESMQKTYPGFHVWPPVADEQVHAIQYLEPLDRRNREAIGYNMYSQSTRRAAMERARDTGEPSATGVVHLVQEIDEDVQSGFLIYLPVYESNGTPGNLEQRRASLSGFVYAPFRADDLLRDIYGPISPSIAFRVFDGTEPNRERRLHTSRGWSRAISARGKSYRTITHMRVGGRIWTLEIVTLPGFSSAESRGNARWIAIIGVLLSLILFGLTRSQGQARVAAENAANELRKSEKELRKTEARVRRLVDSNIIGIILGRDDGSITEGNDAFLSMIGVTAETLHGSPTTLDDLSAPSSIDLQQYALAEIRRKGHFGPYEHVFLRSDGTEVPALVGMALVEKSSNDWVGFVLDLTDRKHMETQLLEQTETLETLNRVQQIVSAELQVSAVLAAVTRAAAALANTDVATFFYRDPAAGSDRSFDSRTGGQTTSHMPVSRDHPVVRRAFADPEAEPPHPDNPEGDGILAVPVISRFGTVVGALVTSHSRRDGFSDRDHQVLSSLAAQAAVAIDNATLYENARGDRNRAEEANRAKDQFLANLSHELRTPMTAIIGWIRMLQIGGLNDEEYQEAITAIARSARAQAQLIEDLLDVSRIATGKMKIEREPVDLLEVIETAVDSVWPSIEAKKLDLESNLPDQPLVVSGDRYRLQQVMWNFLTNAVKFTGEGGRIELVATRSGGNAVVSVRDTGEGIDPQVLPHIFERFHQADATTTRSFGGLGLGLSLVDYIIRAHGGQATAESEGRGSGSCFRIEIPLIETSGAGDADDSLSLEELSLTGRRILVVEDEQVIRDLVQMILRRAGAKVTSVRSAAQALDHLSNDTYDVLVSDIAMPEEDGLSLIRQIRTGRKIIRSVPAVALTSYAGDEDRRRILEAGYDAHLVKPIEPEVLLRTIREVEQTAGRSHEG